MIWVAYRNELTKMGHRLAFWIAYIFYAAIALIGYLEDYIRARRDPERTFALPSAWDDILTEDAQVNFIFAGVVLVLLIANEFQWRTARQNVIDGLSKEQWFVGKLLLVPTLVLVFMGTRTVVGVTLAWMGTDRSVDVAMMTGAHWATMIGVALGLVGVLSLALFASLAVRNTGSAMAIWFFYIVALESLIAGGLVELSERFRPIVRFFPMSIFQEVQRYLQYDTEAYEAYVARLLADGREPAGFLETPVLWGSASAWILALVLLSFVWFRRRDL